MNTKLATRQIRIAEWASIIKACKSSGLKIDEYSCFAAVGQIV